MERTKNMRNEALTNRLQCEEKQFPLDEIIVTINKINEDGTIEKASTKKVIDYAEETASIPAVAGKLMYKQQYGTLNDNKIVKIGYSRSIDLPNIIDSIIINNKEEEK